MKNLKYKQRWVVLTLTFVIAILLHIIITGGMVKKASPPKFSSQLHSKIDSKIKPKEMIKQQNEVVTDGIEQIKYSNDGKWKTFEVTAYTAGYESTGKTPDHPLYGITASGNKVQPRHTIACPPSMPFGTKVYIPKMDNVYVCEDRGSAIVEGRLDIYMVSLEKALNFGRQNLEVQIIN